MVDGNTIDYRTVIDEFAKDFIGRTWLHDIVDAFLSAAGPTYFLLLGEPGCGKSAFLADLVRRREYPHHFIGLGNRLDLGSSTDLRSPVRMAESLAHQLMRKFGNWVVDWKALGVDINVAQKVGTLDGDLTGVRFEEFTAVAGRPTGSISVNQEVDHLSDVGRVIGVSIDNLRLNVSESFSHLLLRPLRRISEQHPDQQIVIVIDALDEADGSGNESIARLLPTSNLPPTVRFIVSSRPGPHLSQELTSHAKTYWLSDDEHGQRDARSWDDARLFVQKLSDEPDVATLLKEKEKEKESPSGDFVERVLKASSGNFLYLHHYALGIRAGDAALADASTAPNGLKGIYKYILETIDRKRLYPELLWTSHYKPLLGTLAVAFRPLTQRQLSVFTGIEQDRIAKLVDQVKQVLAVVDISGQRYYHLYHASFAHFLVSGDNSNDSIEAEAAHRRIADSYFRLWRDANGAFDELDRVADDEVRSYGLQFVPAHLRIGNDREKLAQVLLAPAFLRARTSNGMIFQLIDDLATAAPVVSVNCRRRMDVVREVIRRDALALKQRPDALMAQLYNGLSGLGSAEDGWTEFVGLLRRRLGPFSLSLVRPRQTTNREVLTGMFHPGSELGLATAATVLRDGRCVVAGYRGKLLEWTPGGDARCVSIEDSDLYMARAITQGGDDDVLVAYTKLHSTSSEHVVYRVVLGTQRSQIACSFRTEGEDIDIVKAIRNIGAVIVVVTSQGWYHEFTTSTQAESTHRCDGYRFSAAAINDEGAVVFANRLEGNVRDEDGGTALLEPKLLYSWSPGSEPELIASYKLSMAEVIRKGRNRDFRGMVSAFSVIALDEDTIYLSALCDLFRLDVRTGEFYYLFSASSVIEAVVPYGSDRIVVCAQLEAVIREVDESESLDDKSPLSDIDAIAPLPDGQVLLLGGMQKKGAWNPLTGTGRSIGKFKFELPLSAVAAARDGSFVETSMLDGHLVAEDFAGSAKDMRNVGVSRVAASHDGRVYCWQSKGKAIRELSVFRWRLLERPGVVPERIHYSHVTAFCPLRDGRFLLGTLHGEVIVWNPRATEVIDVFKFDGQVIGVGELPSGAMAACDEAGTLMCRSTDQHSVATYLLGGTPAGLACSRTDEVVTVAMKSDEIIDFTLGDPRSSSVKPNQRRWKLPYLSALFLRDVPQRAWLKVLIAVAIISVTAIWQDKPLWKSAQPLRDFIGIVLFVATFVILVDTFIKVIFVLGPRRALIRNRRLRINGKAARPLKAKKKSEPISSPRRQRAAKQRLDMSRRAAAVALYATLIILAFAYPRLFGWLFWFISALVSVALLISYRSGVKSHARPHPALGLSGSESSKILFRCCLPVLVLLVLLFNLSPWQLIWMISASFGVAYCVGRLCDASVPFLSTSLRIGIRALGLLFAARLDPLYSILGQASWEYVYGFGELGPFLTKSHHERMETVHSHFHGFVAPARMEAAKATLPKAADNNEDFIHTVVAIDWALTTIPRTAEARQLQLDDVQRWMREAESESGSQEIDEIRELTISMVVTLLSEQPNS